MFKIIENIKHAEKGLFVVNKIWRTINVIWAKVIGEIVHILIVMIDFLLFSFFHSKMENILLKCSCRRRSKGFALLVLLIAVSTVAQYTLKNRASSALAIVGDFFWLDLFHSKYFIPRDSIIMPQHISYLIQPERSCNNEAYIAVLIPSHPKDGLKRTIIRKTWGHALIQDQWPHAKLGKHADIFFLLGRASNQLLSRKHTHMLIWL